MKKEGANGLCQEWLRNKVCGWVPHPQNNENGKKEEKNVKEFW